MNILVPTDFSECAKWAFDVGCQLAKLYNGTLHLYHSAAIPDDWELLPPEEKYKDEFNKSVALQARNQLQTLSNHCKQVGIESDIHFTGGDFINNIVEILGKVEIDLIVMGSYGASGKKEWFIGSNTQKVIRSQHYKVLVIKNQIEHVRFKTLLFATSLHSDQKETFRHLLNFLGPLGIEQVHVLAVDTSSFFSQPTYLMEEALKDFQKIASEFTCSTHFYADYSVESGIRHFAEDHNIDLVAISNHQRHPFKRIFFGSTVEMLINHSDIPVLSIDYK